MALCRGEDAVALKFWEEAISMKELHFDTTVNYLIYKWRTGQLSDDELIQDLGKEIF